MSIWTFLDYVETDGSAPVERWLVEDVGAEARGAIDQRLLAQSAVVTWNDKWIKKRKTSDGIYELRLNWNKREFRLLGCYRQGREFVLLEGAIERDSKLPKHAVTRAEERRQTLLKEPNRVRLHSYRPRRHMGGDV